MGSTENFCLRWNDFESNISSSFRDLRQDSEFFDVTLCCDNGKDLIQAHKVILAACSPLFHRILSNNRNQNHPFLYLKGINESELSAILNFMYHGEVNVSQESLSLFLEAAEELAVKGLASNYSKTEKKTAKSQKQSKSNFVNIDEDEDDQTWTPSRNSSMTGSRKTVTKRSTSVAKRRLVEEDEEVDLKRIKSEPVVGLVEDEEELVQEDFDESFHQFEDIEPGTSDRGKVEIKGDLVEARFSRTRFGNALLIDPLGYSYSMNQKKAKRIYWVCNANRKLHCRGSAITEGFFIVKSAGTEGHTHAPKPSVRHSEMISANDQLESLT